MLTVLCVSGGGGKEGIWKGRGITLAFKREQEMEECQVSKNRLFFFSRGFERQRGANFILFSREWGRDGDSSRRQKVEVVEIRQWGGGADGAVCLWIAQESVVEGEALGGLKCNFSNITSFPKVLINTSLPPVTPTANQKGGNSGK